MTDLIDHRLSHTEDRPYECYTCKKSFTQLEYLKKHVRTHDQQRPYSCSQCYKSFHRLCDLQHHLVLHTGESPYQCDECGKTFSNCYSKRRHELSHSREKPFKCNSCDKTFNHIEYLKKHMVMHTGERPFICSICEKAFPRVSALRSHRMTHTGERPYKCDSCDKAFNQSSSLKRHKLLHAGLKPYKCDFCDRAFTESDKLKIHLTAHTGDKPYCCGLCDKTFSRLFKLRRHMASHRSKEPYKCNYCDNTFTEKYRLRIHTRMHCVMHTETKRATEIEVGNLHNRKVVGRKLVQKPSTLRGIVEFTDIIRSQTSAEDCDKVTFLEDVSYLEANEGSNAKSIKMEDLQLDVIEIEQTEQKTKTSTDDVEEMLGKDNCNRQSLNDTMKIINIKSGERRFMCALCNRMYTRLYDLNRHQVTHSGDRPYKCGMCDKSFAYFTSMKRHAIIHTGERRYSCESCGRAFSQLEYLKKHVVVHAKGDPYSDTTREEKSSKSSQLRVCKETLTEEMRKKHEFCPETYHSSADRKHTTRQPHKSSLCPKKFAQLHVLKRERSYVCCLCEHRFKGSQELMAHIYRHNGIEPYSCTLSLSYNKPLSKLQKGLESDWLSEKMSSKQQSSKKVQACETQKDVMVGSYRRRAGKTLKLLYSNAEMINTNTSFTKKFYSCSSCGKSFSTLHHLTKHLQIHSEALYICYLCSASFANASSMKVHIYKHIGLIPYKCSICDMEFRHTVDLRRHVLSHANDMQYRCCLSDKTFSKDKSPMKKCHLGANSCMCICCRKALSPPELEKLKRKDSSERLEKLIPHPKFHNITVQDDRPSKCEDIQNGHQCHSRSTNENLLQDYYACGICFEGFKTKSDVAEHFDSYGGANACSKFSVALSQTQSA